MPLLRHRAVSKPSPARARRAAALGHRLETMRAHGGLTLLLGTGLYVALYAARVLTSGRLTYAFLLWNLALAWVPWLAAQASRAAAARRWDLAAWGFGVAWLAFFPNAPYLVTDFVHLRPRPGVPLWYDIAMLGTAALIGFAAGGLSLRTVHGWVSDRYGTLAGIVLLASSALAAGVGIYLGRFERWNSWDLLARPGPVLRDVLALVVEPQPRALVVTLVFAALTGLAYLIVGGRIIAAATPKRARSTRPPMR